MNLSELDKLLAGFLVQAEKLNRKLSELQGSLATLTGSAALTNIEKKTLSEREKKILMLMAQKKSTSAIAKALDLSMRTVEVHRHNIRKKLKIDSKVDLATIAKQLGLS